MRPILGTLLRRVASCRLLVMGAVAFVGPLQGQEKKGGPSGDNGFRPGDLVYLSVDSEKTLTDTFTVVAGPALVLPTIGSVPLAGVKRTDVQKQLEIYIGRFIREPIIHARAIVRIAISGEVGRSGFFPVPVSAVIPEVLMSAGGPTANARLDHITIKRRGNTLYAPDSLHAAIGRGITLAELDVWSADEIVVPRKGDFEATMRTVGYLLTIPALIFGILRTVR